MQQAHHDSTLAARWAGPPLRVFFDGDCGVCTWCMQWARRRDRFERLSFFGQTRGEALPEGVDPEAFAELAERTVIAWEPSTGQVWTRHHAIARVIAALPFGVLWSWPLRVPGLGFLFGPLYEAFARRRHRISAWLGMGVCGVDDGPPARDR